MRRERANFFLHESVQLAGRWRTLVRIVLRRVFRRMAQSAQTNVGIRTLRVRRSRHLHRMTVRGVHGRTHDGVLRPLLRHLRDGWNVEEAAGPVAAGAVLPWLQRAAAAGVLFSALGGRARDRVAVAAGGAWHLAPQWGWSPPAL